MNELTSIEKEIAKRFRSIAIRLVSFYGDQAEEVIWESVVTQSSKDLLLGAVKERRVRLWNLRGYE